MHRRTFLIAASLASIVPLAGLTGCFGAAAGSNGSGNGNGNGNGSNATNDSSNSSSYQQVDAETAKEIMDTEDDYVILDARTQAEYDEGHIPGAILIPHDTVATAAEDALPDKDQLILVYCRSGNRSKQPHEHSWTSVTPMSSSSVASTAGLTRSNSGRPPGSTAPRLYQAKHP